MADKPTSDGFDYGHRTYMNAEDYTSSVKRQADSQYDRRVKRPHSDDKKPYMDDEYPEMEHYYTPYDPPNFVPPGVPDDPRIPPGDPDAGYPGGPGGDVPGTGEFLGCLFGIPRGPSVIKRGETTFSGIGIGANDRLVNLYVNYGPAKLLTTYTTVNNCVNLNTPNCIVSARALEGFDGNDYDKLGGNHPVQVVAVTASGQTCTWEFYVPVCPPDVTFEWDGDNNPTMINAGDDSLIYVLGGAPPFEWAVSGGEGFSLSESETSVRYNLLSLSALACGTATVTVIDACDDEVTGTIRSDNGAWVDGETFCTCGTGAGGCCSGDSCISEPLRYNLQFTLTVCQNNGQVTQCSWLGGCNQCPPYCSCPDMCSGTQQNPCCSDVGPGDICNDCLEEDPSHDTIYRKQATIQQWDCP